MKRIKFLCGNRFTQKTVYQFIKENFPESEVDFYSNSLLSSIHYPRHPKYYDCIIIGDNIDTSDTPLRSQGYFSPIFLRDYIIARLGYAPKICLFSNPSDYPNVPINEEIFTRDFAKENLHYINNLQDDAFTKLYDFIKSL